MIIGDYYFAKGAYLLAEIGMPAIDSAISHAVMTICMGELLQMTSRNEYDQSLADYHRKIGRKTATLVSTSCYGGGLIAGLDAERRREPCAATDTASAWHSRSPTTSSITSPPARRWASRSGADLRQGTVTLPLMLALNDREVGAELRDILARNDLNEDDFDTVVQPGPRLERDRRSRAQRSGIRAGGIARAAGLPRVVSSRDARAGLRLRGGTPDLITQCAFSGHSAPRRRTSVPNARAHAARTSAATTYPSASARVAGIVDAISLSLDAAMRLGDRARRVDSGEEQDDHERDPDDSKLAAQPGAQLAERLMFDGRSPGRWLGGTVTQAQDRSRRSTGPRPIRARAFARLTPSR